MAISKRALHQQTNAEFDGTWVEISRRLDRFLAAKGIPTHTREDVIQETAVRLWERWTRLDRSSPLWNLAVTIAMRLVYDEHRRRRKIELVAEVDAAAVGGEIQALQHAQLREAVSTIGRLPRGYRNVLLAQIGEADSPTRNRNELNVLRFRARRALRQRLGRWAPSAVSVRFRDLWTRTERHLITSGPYWPNTVLVLLVASAMTVSATGSAPMAGNYASDDVERISLMERPQLIGVSRSDGSVGALQRRRNQPRAGGARGRARPIGDTWRRVTEEYHGGVREVHRRYSDTLDEYKRTITTVHRTNSEGRQRVDRIRERVQSTHEAIADRRHSSRERQRR